MPPFIDADAIRAATFVRTVEVHETLSSTNDRAAELARNMNIALPALVVARHQTAGRGRGTNRWQSGEGALTFSLLVDPLQYGICTAKWPRLSLATAIAVCDALADQVGWAPPTTCDELPNKEKMVGGAHPTHSQAARLALKWPNDVMLDGGKVCGILVESPGGAAPAKNRLVIGIGININNSCHAMPRESGPNRITLCDVTQQEHDLQAILIAVIHAIELRLIQVGGDDPQLARSWQEKCWLTEQSVEIQSANKWVEGICLGIDGDGALLVEDVVGVHRFSSGSVRVK